MNTRTGLAPSSLPVHLMYATNTGNVQGLRANHIAAFSTDGVLFPKSIRNMSEISEVSEVSELCPKFEHCFYRNIANF